jgi:hypothetical protein
VTLAERLCRPAHPYYARLRSLYGPCDRCLAGAAVLAILLAGGCSVHSVPHFDRAGEDSDGNPCVVLDEDDLPEDEPDKAEPGIYCRVPEVRR